MVRRWSTLRPRRGRFPSAFESNELDHVTMQFLRNSPLFEDETEREREASVNGVVKRVERKGDASDMWMRERERGINKKGRKKGKNGEEKEERLRGEKWLSKTHFLRACDVLH